MGYSDTLLNSSAEARIVIEELTYSSGSWSWSDWESLKENLKVAGGYKRRENYTVINWKEITLGEYKEFEGKIG